MLNRILKKLNGHAAEPTSLSAALAQLGRDRADAEAEIKGLTAERKQLLLDDATDAQLDKIERQIDRANARLEKICLAEPGLREALAAATAAERGRRWEAHLEAHRKAAAEFLSAARAVVERHADLVAIVQAAQGEGFAGDVARAMPVTPNINGSPICEPRALDKFERALAPLPRAPGRPPRGGIAYYVGQPGSAYYDPTRPPGPSKPTLSHAVVMAPMGNRDAASNVGARTHASRLPNDEQPLAEGEVRCVVLRGGFQAPDGASQVGRRIRLPRDTALQAARAGAIDIVEDPVQQQVERLSEGTFHTVGSVSEAHQDPTVIAGRRS